MGKVRALCISERKGTQKEPRQRATFITDFGIEEDAHAGKWHRQVSLIGQGQIDAFKARGAQVEPGAFGENVIVDGFDFKTLPVGTKLQCKDVILEITQIGKQCHKHCHIYHQVGDCIMPREGVFAQVLQGGSIEVGDEMQVIVHDESRYTYCK